MEAEDTEAIKRSVESGFGYSVLPEHALRRRTRFFHAFRVDGHPVVRGLALAMVRTEYPRRADRVGIAEPVRAMDPLNLAALKVVGPVESSLLRLVVRRPKPET